MPQISERIFFSFICRFLIVFLDFFCYVDKIKPNHEKKNCSDKSGRNEKRSQDWVVVADSETNWLVVVVDAVAADVIVATIERRNYRIKLYQRNASKTWNKKNGKARSEASRQNLKTIFDAKLRFALLPFLKFFIPKSGARKAPIEKVKWWSCKIEALFFDPQTLSIMHWIAASIYPAIMPVIVTMMIRSQRSVKIGIRASPTAQKSTLNESMSIWEIPNWSKTEERAFYRLWQ